MTRLLGWKNHLAPPILCTFYFLIPFQTFSSSDWQSICLFILAAIVFAGYGYWINDWFDIAIDKKAGKKNITANYSNFINAFITILLLFVGICLWYFVTASFFANILLTCQIILLTIYSMPPVRLKNHWLLGPLCDTHYGHVLPVFITIFTFYHNVNMTIILIILYSLLFVKGFRNILVHQIHDRKGDRKSGIQTFPTKVKPIGATNFINWVLLPLEISLISYLVIYVSLYYNNFTVIYVWLAFLSFQFTLFSSWKFRYKRMRKQMRSKFYYFLNDFYEIWLPYLIIWIIPIEINYKIVLTLSHLILFISGIKKTIKDIGKVIINMGIIQS